MQLLTFFELFSKYLQNRRNQFWRIRVQQRSLYFSPRRMSLLDVHAVSKDQQSAVAYSIASSHEDIHEVMSVSSCADLTSQSAVPSTSHKEWISA